MSAELAKTGDQKLWRGGVPLTVQQGLPGKPIVLLCGWMGSVDKHIAKYADVYATAGCTVVRCSLPSEAGMKGDTKKIAKCASSALARVDECRGAAGKEAPFYLHIFSNNGSWLYASMLRTIASKPSGEDGIVLSQLKGVVFDSCPAYMWISGGLGAMSMAVPPGLPRRVLQAMRSAVLLAHRGRYLAALAAVWLLMKKRWKQFAALALAFALSKHGETFGLPAQFWKAMMDDPLLMIPRLYVFSKDDHLTDHEKLQELIDHRRAKGQVGMKALCFDSSPHCGHLRTHPTEYSDAVLRFVGADLASRKWNKQWAMAAIPETMKAVVNKASGSNVVYGVAEVPTPTITGDKDLIIKMVASPVNPSDLGMIGMVARFGGDNVVAGEESSTVAAPLPEAAAGMFAGKTHIACGSEGTGVVVAAGASPEAQALIGKNVAGTFGGTYAQYAKTTLDVKMFAVVPDGTGIEGAALFVNPLTVVGFVHTMREEGHKAIVHTAAASQVGRMLVKHCKEEGIQLVNIVRKEEGVATLKALGAEFVVNSSAPTFKEDLLAAVTATEATIAFDATGGGTLAQDILTAFEQSLRQRFPDTVVGWYGPPQQRSVYKYGGLDKRPSEFANVGVGNWTWGGWLMPFHYDKFPREHLQAGIVKAVAGMTTTFSSTFGEKLSLEDMAASPERYKASLASQTDEKFLVMPNGA